MHVIESDNGKLFFPTEGHLQRLFCQRSFHVRNLVCPLGYIYSKSRIPLAWTSIYGIFWGFSFFLRVDIFEIFCLAYLSLQTLFFQKLCIFLVYGKMDMLKKMTLSFLWKRDECIFWEFFIKFTDWNAISHSEQKREEKSASAKKSVNLAPFFYLENFVFLVKKSLTKNSQFQYFEISRLSWEPQKLTSRNSTYIYDKINLIFFTVGPFLLSSWMVWDLTVPCIPLYLVLYPVLWLLNHWLLQPYAQIL